MLLWDLKLANYSVKLCTDVTISLNFDLNSEVSNKKVIVYYR